MMDAIPRSVRARLRKVILENRDNIYQEIRETKELYTLLMKWSRQGSISAAERATVKAQLFDICKTIPAIAIFLIPFGTVVLALLIKYLPFDILPDAFADSPDRENPMP